MKFLKQLFVALSMVVVIPWLLLALVLCGIYAVLNAIQSVFRVLNDGLFDVLSRVVENMQEYLKEEKLCD